MPILCLSYKKKKKTHQSATCWTQNKTQFQGHQLISNNQAATRNGSTPGSEELSNPTVSVNVNWTEQIVGNALKKKKKKTF